MGVNAQRGRYSVLDWVKPHPFLRAWQAPMFHMKRFWIYAASCSHFSSVNHLGAVRSCSPRPQANRWPAGEIEWKPAKPDTLKALSRIHAEMGRIEQQSNLECVYPRPENSCAANSVFAIICSLSKKKVFDPRLIQKVINTWLHSKQVIVALF